METSCSVPPGLRHPVNETGVLSAAALELNNKPPAIIADAKKREFLTR